MNHTEVKPNRESHQPTIADIFRVSIAVDCIRAELECGHTSE